MCGCPVRVAAEDGKAKCVVHYTVLDKGAGGEALVHGCWFHHVEVGKEGGSTRLQTEHRS